MTTYLVHVPPTARPGSSDGLERTVLVKDGIHWLALVFPVLWLLYHRAWLPLLAYLAAALALLAAGQLADLPQGATIAAQLVLSCALAVFGADVRSLALRRRGLAPVDVVSADGEEQALRRFLDRWLATPAASEHATGRTGRVFPAGHALGQSGVLGLFPDAGRP